jgi:hypothetical protein
MSKKRKREERIVRRATKKRIARLRAADPGYPPEDPPPIAALLPQPNVMPYPTMGKHGQKSSLPNLVLDNPS